GKQYEVILHSDTDEGGFWIECPEFNVASQGETIKESLDMITEAIEGYLEVIEEIKQEKKSE
ncbi:MAG: type II toxin-antitoxin system HicB family antitoxin, partial [Candidatus Magnetoovum sp. WYHC-5]|nr:type II toxin-antitoxin system HicB family antitoxin [Candidatus Magnetoovum sp. WYHC-5]